MDDYFDQSLTQVRGFYAVPFRGVTFASATEQDAFSLVTPATVRLGIRAIFLNQYSDFGPSEAEIIPVAIIEGNAVDGSGGGLVTPVPRRPWMPPALTVARVNDTTLASGGTELVHLADGWNVAAGWPYSPPVQERIFIGPSKRVVVRLGGPADNLTVNGTIVFEEFSA